MLSVAVLIRELRRSGRPRGPGQQAFQACQLVGWQSGTTLHDWAAQHRSKLAEVAPKLAQVGRPWSLWGRLWPLGPLLAPLGLFLGRSWAALGPLLATLGPLLDRSWAAPDLSWLALGTSWTSFGPSWPSLGSQELIFTKTSIGPVFCGSDLASGAPKLARSWAKLA